jgi:hypothetical protein
MRLEPAQDLVGDGRAGAKPRGEGVDPVPIPSRSILAIGSATEDSSSVTR